MIKLKNILNESELNEAPMDRNFQKEWEQMHTVFINHLKHESRNRKYGPSEKGAIKNMLRTLETSKGFAELLSDIAGLDEQTTNTNTNTSTTNTSTTNTGGINFDPNKFQDQLTNPVDTYSGASNIGQNAMIKQNTPVPEPPKKTYQDQFGSSAGSIYDPNQQRLQNAMQANPLARLFTGIKPKTPGKAG